MNTNNGKKVSIFCGHRSGKRKVWANFASKLGTFLGKNEYTVIYGAGSKGIMGIVASAAKENGSQVHGIITEQLANIEPILEGLDKVTIVKTLYERKEKLIQQSDVVVVLPGGIGTLDEFFDVWAKIQLGIINKPVIVANINNYYSKLLSFIDAMIVEDFLLQNQLSSVRVCSNLGELIRELKGLQVDRTKNIHKVF